MIVLDEHDQPWYVVSGDPAWLAASALIRQGFRQIVLPRRTIITGELIDRGANRLQSAAESYRALQAAGANPSTLEPIARAFLREAVLLDCCAATQKALG